MQNYQHLADCIKDGSLVAFIGAGVSRTYTDSTSGSVSCGLMSASEIVEDLSRKRSYITADMGFLEACFLYKQQEGRVALERYLQETIDRPAVKPLPAHVILANIPFSSYITTNYDRLLEISLQESKKSPFPITDDNDVSRFRTASTPVIKIHGCISRPSGMIACEDEYASISERQPVVEALIKTHIANKSILFLGYSLDDADFKQVYNEVKSALGDNMPRSYAVVYSATAYQIELWKTRGVAIIEYDLTDYLRGLLRKSIESKSSTIYHTSEDWVNNAFFESLHKIRTSPSETQAIDAFLKHLMKEVRSPAFALNDIIDRAKKAAQTVLRQKQNFEAFSKISDSITQEMENCPSKENAEDIISRLITDRKSQSIGMMQKWAEVIEKGDNVLTYSQSVRVAEIFQGAPRGVQDSCHVFISECRPKSPMSFRDALAISDSLTECGYQLTLVPDACVGHLLARNQIDKIVIGAHAIHFVNGEPKSFVNTCGSSQLLDSALRHRIPVFVIAESSKFIEVDNDDEISASYEEEEDVFEDIFPSISELKSSGVSIGTLNIGYDLCHFFEGVHLISELEQEPCPR